MDRQGSIVILSGVDGPHLLNGFAIAYEGSFAAAPQGGKTELREIKEAWQMTHDRPLGLPHEGWTPDQTCQIMACTLH